MSLTTARRRLSAILQAVDELPGLQKAIRQATVGVLPRELPELRVEVAWIGDDEMREANQKFRRKDSVTDVLSFPAPQALRIVGFLGEIAICGPQLKRQAREVGNTAAQELDVLLVHGVLHLLGFDHERSKAASLKMAEWEFALLDCIRPKRARKSGVGLIERFAQGR